MTLIPKKAQVVIIATFIIFVVTILVRHNIYTFDLEDLSALNQEVFTSTYVLSNGVKTEIPTDDLPSLLNSISLLESQWWTGAKGEKWTYFCTLNFVPKDGSPIYRIAFSSRGSMDGNILAELQRISGSSTYNYGDYNGNVLVAYVKSHITSC
jgi:hypothetical protein